MGEAEFPASPVPPVPRSCLAYPPTFTQPTLYNVHPALPPHNHLQHYYYTPFDDTDISPSEEDVFVAVNLPVNDSTGNDAPSPNAPSSSSAVYNTGGGNNNGGSSSSASPTHLQRISYQHRRPPPALPPALPPLNRSDDDVLSGEDKNKELRPHAKPDGEGTSDYPYVQFVHDRPSSQMDKPPPGGVITSQPPLNHDYYYPVIEGKKPDGSSRERRDSIDSIKRANQLQDQQLMVASTLSSVSGGFGLSSVSRKDGNLPMRSPASVFGSFTKPDATRGGKSYDVRGGGKQKDALSSLTSGGGLKQQNLKGNIKLQCRHCRDSFYPENNPRGSCEYAPDFFRSAMDALTCIGCAQCMLYHCMSDKEAEYVRHPCTCSGGCCESTCCLPTRGFPCCCCSCCRCCRGDGDRGTDMVHGGPPDPGGSEMVGLGASKPGSNILDNAGSGCGRRWVGLTLLSLLVPCLCCYLPLKGCHSAFVSCGVCGGKHEAVAGGGRHNAASEDKFGPKHIESKLAAATRGGGGGRYTAGRFSGGGRFDGGS
ncbi:hypothetical protein HAZT_HAZT003470 [Hyalella azteca]|nr:hypothetical protein HAZT_HAZT003470 [Hyalella azteca]